VVTKWWKKDRFRPLGLIVVGVLFVALTLYLGNDIEWDLSYVFSSYRGDVVAWLLLGACFLLGAGSIVLGAVQLARRPGNRPAPRKPHVWGAKPLFDENGKRIHYDDN